MATFQHQQAVDLEAMDVDGDDAKQRECTPENVLYEFFHESINCNFRVLGNQLGLTPFDLNLLEVSCSGDQEQLLRKMLQKCADRDLLSWPKVVSVLRKPSLKQYRVANRIERKYNLVTSTKSGDSCSSAQSSRSMSLEDSLTTLSHVHPEDAPHLQDVVNEIADVVNWEKLGILLGLSVEDVDMIRTRHNRDEHHQRLAELLQDRDKDYTWSNLLKQVDKLYPRRSSSVSVSSPPPESFDVEAHIKKFEKKFKELNIEARKELEEEYHSDSVRIVKDELTYLPISIAKEHYKFVTQLTNRKKAFPNLTTFFRHLNLYCWNFFEYHALQNLIENKCSEELNKKMTQYATEIEKFRRRTTISEFFRCGRLPIKSRTIPPRFEKVTMEHAIDPDVYTLEDIDHFRKDTYKALHLKLSECAFQVYSIFYGSVVVEWMIPEEFLKPVEDLFYSEIGRKLLKVHDVERFLLNDKELPLQSLFLLTAAKEGDIDEVRSLLEHPKTNVNYQEHPGGWTALHLAATEGHVEIAEMLLKKGCDVHLLAGEGWTPLQRVCLYKERTVARRGEMVNLLLDHDAMLNIEDRSGRNALFAASTSGFVDIVKILLERIARLPKRIQKRLINNEMMNGWFPIMDAAKYGHTEVIKLLLEAGATAIKTKDDDETALHIAAYHGHVDVVKVLTASRDRLLINARDKYGLTPLMMAVDRGYNEVADVLLEAGADVNLQSNDKERRTALMLAAKSGAFSIVKLLLKHKPDVTIKDSNNKTAYDLASNSEVRHCLTDRPVTKPETEIGVST